MCTDFLYKTIAFNKTNYNVKARVTLSYVNLSFGPTRYFITAPHCNPFLPRPPNLVIGTGKFVILNKINCVSKCRYSSALRPMQTDATSHNIVACCGRFLANNVASVCMGLKV